MESNDAYDDDLELKLKKWKLDALRSSTQSAEDTSDANTEIARRILNELVSEYPDPLQLINIIHSLSKRENVEEAPKQENTVEIATPEFKQEITPLSPLSSPRMGLKTEEYGRKRADSLVLSRRFLFHLVERIGNPEEEHPLTMFDRKFFTGSRLIEWMKNSSTAESETDGILIGQQLLDSQLIFPIDSTQKIFYNDPLQLFYLENQTSGPAPRDEKVVTIQPTERTVLDAVKSMSTCILFDLWMEQSSSPLMAFWLDSQAIITKSQKSAMDETAAISALCSKYFKMGSSRFIQSQVTVVDLASLTEVQKEVATTLETSYLPRFLTSNLFEFYTSYDNDQISKIHLHYLLQKMQRSIEDGGLTRRNVSVSSHAYCDCFTGEEAIDWVVRNLALEMRKKAIDIFKHIISYRDWVFYLVEPSLRDDSDLYYSFQNVSKVSKPKHSRTSSKKKRVGSSDSRSSSFQGLPGLPSSQASIDSRDEIITISQRRRRNSITKQQSKHLIMKNFEEYSSQPVQVEKLLDNLTLGATLSYGQSFSGPSTPLTSPEVTPVSSPTVDHVRAPTPALNPPLKKLHTSKLRRDTNLSLANKPRSEEAQSPGDKADIIKNRSTESPKRQKLKNAADIFNAHPKKGIEKLVEDRQLLRTPEDIAKFLHSNVFLAKDKIGELLGEGDEFYITVMKNFIEQMDFTDLDFDIALRHLLYCFRLPGESQKIDRILEKFSLEYTKNNNEGIFANSDAAFALAFAVIMLNTDAHNPQIKKKMTKAQFIHNCRGINDGGNLPNDFLEETFDRIVLDEIRMKTDGALFPDASKKGWLILQITKRGKITLKWKRFWFVLMPKTGLLLYFKKPGDSTPIGSLALLGAELQVQNMKEKKFAFSILPQTAIPLSAESSPVAVPIGSRRPTLGGSKDVTKTKIGLPMLEEGSKSLDAVSKGINSGLDSWDLAVPSEREFQSWVRIVKKTIDMQLKGEESGKTKEEPNDDRGRSDDSVARSRTRSLST